MLLKLLWNVYMYVGSVERRWEVDVDDGRVIHRVTCPQCRAI